MKREKIDLVLMPCCLHDTFIQLDKYLLHHTINCLLASLPATVGIIPTTYASVMCQFLFANRLFITGALLLHIGLFATCTAHLFTHHSSVGNMCCGSAVVLPRGMLGLVNNVNFDPRRVNKTPVEGSGDIRRLPPTTTADGLCR